MAALAIPAHYEAVTPEWLTQALRAGGALRDASVTAVDAAPLGEQRGFTGVIVRFELAYDRKEADAPASLVGKFPTAARLDFDHSDAETSEWITRLYRREVRFYRDIAPQAPIRTPHVYYGDVDAENYRAALLFEDLSDARPADPDSGWTSDQLRAIIANIARLHAAFWGEPASVDWLDRDDADPEGRAENYAKTWPVYREKFAAQSALLLELGPRIEARLPALTRRLGASPGTLLHGDYHGRNICFRGDASEAGAPPGDAGQQIIFDWQAPLRGNGLIDVANFLALSGETERRRALEDELLHLYHATLVANGVEGYSPARCREDYRLALFRTMARMMLVLTNIDFSDEGEGAADAVIRRIEAIIADNDVGALL